jgi:hypothetical protein
MSRLERQSDAEVEKRITGCGKSLALQADE